MILYCRSGDGTGSLLPEVQICAIVDISAAAAPPNEGLASPEASQAFSHEAEVIVICRSSTIDRGLARLQTLQLDKVEIGAQGWQPWHRGLVCKKRQWSLYGLCKGSTVAMVEAELRELIASVS